MGTGVVIGAVIGAAIHNVGVGVAIGIVLGAAIGPIHVAVLGKRNRGRGER